jgi:hypothetical protein
MLLDSIAEVDLIQSSETSFGLPVFMVIDNKPRKAKIRFFRGETAYSDAQRFMDDIVIPRIHCH